jgi:hypothetical protein
MLGSLADLKVSDSLSGTVVAPKGCCLTLLLGTIQDQGPILSNQYDILACFAHA